MGFLSALFQGLLIHFDKLAIPMLDRMQSLATLVCLPLLSK